MSEQLTEDFGVINFVDIEQNKALDPTSDNSGYETDSIGNWSKAGSSLDVLRSQSEIVYKGRYALEANANGSPAAGSRCRLDIATEYNLILGEEYTIIIRYRHVGSANNDGDWKIYFNSDGSLTETIAVADVVKTDIEFTEYSIKIVGTADYKFLNAKENNADNDGGIILDDISVISALGDEDRGSKILPELFKNSVNVPGLINAIMPEIQELHDAQSDVYSTINIFDAVGTQLDDIFGELLDTPREGSQSDDDYRAVLLAVAPSIAGSGTILVLKATLRSLAKSSNVSLQEVIPHTILMHAIVNDFGDITNKSVIDESMQKIKGGGIYLDVGIQEDGNAFIFSDDVGGGSIAGEGFATLSDGSDGGSFARLNY
jgi:hypothetical protein